MFDVEAFVKEKWPKGLPLRCREKDRKDGDSEAAIMYFGGDFKLLWNPDNAAETEAARVAFESLRDKGFQAFKVEGERGDKGDQLPRAKFDPRVGKMIMAPAIQGGI
jgi:hypothetical protein